jgi:hypothetical protein
MLKLFFPGDGILCICFSSTDKSTGVRLLRHSCLHAVCLLHTWFLFFVVLRLLSCMYDLYFCIATTVLGVLPACSCPSFSTIDIYRFFFFFFADFYLPCYLWGMTPFAAWNIFVSRWSVLSGSTAPFSQLPNFIFQCSPYISLYNENGITIVDKGPIRLAMSNFTSF